MGIRNTIYALLACMIFSVAAKSDGMIFPIERPNTSIVKPNSLFTVKYHYVDVAIQDQLCTTKVDQVFHNDQSVDLEGMYMFPMPEGSAITNFAMFDGEKKIEGKILGKDEARNLYESIVRQRKDPAILEYIDRNTFRARVYPIPANGDKRIQLSYAELIKKTGNVCHYTYPLSTERFSAEPLSQCKVTITIKSSKPIANIYSPTHQLDIDRVSDREARVTWSAKDTKPDTDMELYYSVSDDDLGVDVISYKQPGEDGYFMLLASPHREVTKTAEAAKNVVFVLDRTGSMMGDKIDQAKQAISFCINSLKQQDSFNVITFNEKPAPLFDVPQKATSENRKKALKEIESLDANGGTNINEVLITAKQQFDKLGSENNYVVFITDGQPTVGDTSEINILTNAKNSSARMFVFGVGYDVNTHLLDKLSEQNRGSSDYIRPSENLETKIGSFFAKVTTPVLTDITLEVQGSKTLDRFPDKDLPDVFTGSQLVILGRYQGSGNAKFILKGKAGGKTKSYVVNANLDESSSTQPYIAQIWAQRKIGYLLNEIRLHSSKELVDEVIRLSKLYGIPTEYTSFLADERKSEADLKNDISKVQLRSQQASGVKSGTYGVAQSTNSNYSLNSTQTLGGAANALSVNGQTQLGEIAANGRIGGTYQDSEDRTVVVANVQNVASRTFYQRGKYWEDANLQPNQKAMQIKQFSDAHFKLIKAYPKLAQYSTLGQIRAIMANDNAIDIGPEGKETLTEAEIKTLTIQNRK